jgi:four helix bundle protein
MGNSENKTVEFKARTKKFALRILKLFQALPRNGEAQVIGKQLLRCGTSVAANYRAVCRARSRAEFIAKIGVVVEEADETVFWLDMLSEGGIVPARKLAELSREANEILAVVAASQRTARGNDSLTH